MQKWDIELLPFDITYKPRRAIKSQVLADFVAEWTEAELPKEYGAYSNWIMHFDGSKMLAGLGAGVVLTSPTGDTVQYVLQIMYMDSNNAAEYEALLHGLRMAISMGIQRLEVRGDSNLAISQVNGDFDAKDPKMAAYRNAVLKMSARFEGLEFHHVARDNNQAADVLARIGENTTPSLQTSSWSGSLSHPYYGKRRPEITTRKQPHQPTRNILTQSVAQPMK